ncbi:lipase 3 [Plutella xylostella]|uniref:lipase 3 n=1 Tax=Plutella xylostella TaxID=51655 RepID=UPI0020321C95|nr:lipase 3 [Plutella xylostella]
MTALLMRWCVAIVLNLGLLSALPPRERSQVPSLPGVSNRVDQTASHIVAAGFPEETHHVVTGDGYILQLHRIPHGRGAASGVRGTPVFMMHGLMATSTAYVQQGPELSMGFNLADAGYDVWLGNARGNRNSRAHTTLDPDQDKLEFFDFSWDDIGQRDLPAMIDYVLTTTGHQKLHYIGHSQGGTVFLVLNSMMPQYNDKFYSAHLLAGVGYMTYFPDANLGALAQRTNTLYTMARRLGFVEIFPPDSNSTSLPDWLFPLTRVNVDCTLSGDICDAINLLRNDRQNKEDSVPTEQIGIFGGAAVKQYAHYGQNIAAKAFRRWDFGRRRNVAVYGTDDPPIYDISLITVNTTMHYTVADNLLDERDVLDMVQVMPNTRARRVARDTFQHVDFVVTDDAKELVTDYIIEAIGLMEKERDEANTEEVPASQTDAPASETEPPALLPEEVISISPPDVPGSSSTLTLGVLSHVSILVLYVLGRI